MVLHYDDEEEGGFFVIIAALIWCSDISNAS